MQQARNVSEDLAAMLSAATNAKRSPDTGDLSLQVQMVAVGSQPSELDFSWTGMKSVQRAQSGGTAENKKRRLVAAFTGAFALVQLRPGWSMHPKGLHINKRIKWQRARPRVRFTRTRRLTRAPIPAILPASAPDRAPPTRGKGMIPTCCCLRRGALHLLSA